MYLAPRTWIKGWWRIFNWEYNCKYNLIHKFFFRVGGKVNILVISENKILVFGIFRCSKSQYVEIICLGNMKEIGCPKIRTESFAIKKYGRKWLHFVCAWDENRIPKQGSLKGKQHRPNLLIGWGLHAFSLSVRYVWIVFPPNWREIRKHPLLFELFFDLYTRINFSLSSSALIVTSITEHLDF